MKKQWCLLYDPFMPDQKYIAPEYWSVKICEHFISFIEDIRSSLTVLAWFTAIGVGNDKASVSSIVMLNELTSLLGQLLGLFLGSNYVNSSYCAENASGIVKITSTIAVFLGGLYAMLYLQFPDYVWIIKISQTITNVTVGVFRDPANAALRSHLNIATDPVARAEVMRRNSNQRRILSLCRLLLRSILIFSGFVTKLSNIQLWISWIILTLSILILTHLKISTFAQPTLNMERLWIILNNLDSKHGEMNCLSPVNVAKREYPVRSLLWGVTVDALGKSSPKIIVGKKIKNTNEKYRITYHRDKNQRNCWTIYIEKNVMSHDILCALLHLYLSVKHLEDGTNINMKTVSASVLATKSNADALFPVFLSSLKKNGWKIDTVLISAELSKNKNNTVKYQYANNKKRYLVNPVLNLILPKGYPGSVAPEYLDFQLWDTLQVACTQLRGVLVSAALLTAVGVGSTETTPIEQVNIDLINSIFSACLGLIVGSLFRSTSSVALLRQWRVRNCFVSYFDVILSLVQAIFPKWRLPLALLNTSYKSVIGPLGAGASTALVMHLSNYSLEPSFVADVSAKEANQDRVLGICLMLVRYAFLKTFCPTGLFAWIICLGLSAGHIGFNFFCARSLILPRLNRPRLNLVLSSWIDFLSIKIKKIPTPTDIARQESIIPSFNFFCSPISWTINNIELGASLQEDDMPLSINKFYTSAGEKYVLIADATKHQLRIGLRENCDCQRAQLRAMLHASLSAKKLKDHDHHTKLSDINKIIKECHADMEKSFNSFFLTLQTAGWDIEHTMLVPGNFRIPNIAPKHFE